MRTDVLAIPVVIRWATRTTVSKVQPYYADDLVTLYHGDCRHLGDVCADLVIADPPYEQTSLDWDRWPIDWPDAMTRIAPSMWVFGSLRMFTRRWSQFSRWQLSQDVIWEKHNGSGFHADRFRRLHEQVAHFYLGEWGERYHVVPTTRDATARTVRRKRRPKHMGEIGGATYISHDGGPRMMTSVLYARSMHGKAENETQKPVELVMPLIEYACQPAGLVFSPFAGSGTDLVAAKRTGRFAIGCEIREEQCEIAARRLSQGFLPDIGHVVDRDLREQG